jgi:hypothetical protein
MTPACHATCTPLDSEPEMVMELSGDQVVTRC